MNDLRYTLRALARQPLFALTAIVTFALGIGANTAIFSVADAFLLNHCCTGREGLSPLASVAEFFSPKRVYMVRDTAKSGIVRRAY